MTNLSKSCKEDLTFDRRQDFAWVGASGGDRKHERLGGGGGWDPGIFPISESHVNPPSQI